MRKTKDLLREMEVRFRKRIIIQVEHVKGQCGNSIRVHKNCSGLKEDHQRMGKILNAVNCYRRSQNVKDEKRVVLEGEIESVEMMEGEKTRGSFEQLFGSRVRRESG